MSDLGKLSSPVILLGGSGVRLSAADPGGLAGSLAEFVLNEICCRRNFLYYFKGAVRATTRRSLPTQACQNCGGREAPEQPNE